MIYLQFSRSAMSNSFVTPMGSSVHRISQGNILNWVAIFLFRGTSQPTERTWLSCPRGGFFTIKIDIYGILHPVTVECMVFLSLKGRFAKLEHTLGHKTNFNKFKRTDIIRSVLSDNNEIRWEIINRNIARKSWDIWRLNSTHK